MNAFALGAGPAGQSIAEEEPVPRYVPPQKQAGAPPDAVVGSGRGGADDEPGGDADERLKLVRREGVVQERALGEPYLMREVERKALIVYKPEPPYTEAARMKNVTGVIRLRVVLSSTGRVTGIEVLKPLPNGLTESAIRVARQMRFFPAEKDGRPVSQYVLLEYNFNIY